MLLNNAKYYIYIYILRSFLYYNVQAIKALKAFMNHDLHEYE